eukprot:3932356-Rhodomonas_salina.1
MAEAARIGAMHGVLPKTIRDIWNRKSWVKATRKLWTTEEAASFIPRRHRRNSNGRSDGRDKQQRASISKIINSLCSFQSLSLTRWSASLLRLDLREDRPRGPRHAVADRQTSQGPALTLSACFRTCRAVPAAHRQAHGKLA